jgi:hypothetical protein
MRRIQVALAGDREGADFQAMPISSAMPAAHAEQVPAVHGDQYIPAGSHGVGDSQEKLDRKRLSLGRLRIVPQRTDCRPEQTRVARKALKSLPARYATDLLQKLLGEMRLILVSSVHELPLVRQMRDWVAGSSPF